MQVRRIAPGDSLEALTALLHRAYARLAAMGFRYLAAHQEGQGLGSRLLAFAEDCAARLGAAEVSVDTAEGAAHLIAFYEARGYREVGHAQWDHTNYRSVLLSKRLGSQAARLRSGDA